MGKVAEIAKTSKPGDWLIEQDGGQFYFVYMCPCGCGDLRGGGIPLHRGAHPPGHASWLWDGNEITPTLEPSIRHLDGCRWHGFFKAGKWSSCTDGPPLAPGVNDG